MVQRDWKIVRLVGLKARPLLLAARWICQPGRALRTTFEEPFARMRSPCEIV